MRDDFHPKRNQARQKLATLPTGRFKDLSSDVYYELSRRYPEFKEEVRIISHSFHASSHIIYTGDTATRGPSGLPRLSIR